MRDRLKSGVRVLPDGCWLWIRAIRGDDYPAVGFNGRQEGGHRVSYAVFNNGGVLPNLCVLHKCDRPLCVNPDHLFLGTVQDNMRDCARKGRKKGEYNANSKLRAADVRHIRYKYRTAGWGRMLAERARLAKRYGVADVTIQKVVRYELWPHLCGIRLVRKVKRGEYNP